IHLLLGLAEYFAFCAGTRALIAKRIGQLDCIFLALQLCFQVYFWIFWRLRAF
ncbi:hypothetical protein K438DRAFT_1879953, partial [Mycena galopus ATCC 62051]